MESAPEEKLSNTSTNSSVCEESNNDLNLKFENVRRLLSLSLQKMEWFWIPKDSEGFEGF